ncbi:MAG: hypothetical protein DRG78_16020 [Epsilonproteobacteria bacterium]|nr:MAG: hypothetical protein DRG78_16020 [Campylobacterota bacterium]
MSLNNALMTERNPDGSYNVVDCANADTIKEFLTPIISNVSAEEVLQLIFDKRDEYEYKFFIDKELD